jgi:transcriptional regulator GlxA family with amidase domain
MKHVSILVPAGTASGAVTAPMDVMNEAGRFKMESDPALDKPFFNIELVALNGEFVECLGGYPLRCHKTVGEVSRTDLIIVPNLTDNFEQKIKDNQGFIEFMRQQYAAGADIGAFCTGTLLLAATGLLNGKKATTH